VSITFLDFVRKVARERRKKGFVIKGGKGSGWFAPPKGTHTKQSRKRVENKKTTGIKVTSKPSGKLLVSKLSKGKGYIQAMHRGDSVTIVNVEVEESQRGKGLGKALYEDVISYAKQNSLLLRGDITSEIGAIRVWASLKRRGYNVIRHPQAESLYEGNTKIAEYVPGLKEPVYTIDFRRKSNKG